MARQQSPDGIGATIVAIRETWHTKNHPFFQKMLDGSLPLRALGIWRSTTSLSAAPFPPRG